MLNGAARNFLVNPISGGRAPAPLAVPVSAASVRYFIDQVT